MLNLILIHVQDIVQTTQMYKSSACSIYHFHAEASYRMRKCPIIPCSCNNILTCFNFTIRKKADQMVTIFSNKIMTTLLMVLNHSHSHHCSHYHHHHHHLQACLESLVEADNWQYFFCGDISSY